MKITSPPLEQKMEFHRLRAQGQFPGGHEGWKLYQEWRDSRRNDPPKSPATDEPECAVPERKLTPQEELGF